VSKKEGILDVAAHFLANSFCKITRYSVIKVPHYLKKLAGDLGMHKLISSKTLLALFNFFRILHI